MIPNYALFTFIQFFIHLEQYTVYSLWPWVLQGHIYPTITAMYPYSFDQRIVGFDFYKADRSGYLVPLEKKYAANV